MMVRIAPKPPERPSPARRGRRTSQHTLPQRLERTRDFYLMDCYARRTAARSDEFAQYAGLTLQYLARTISRVFGMSSRDFLRRQQLRYAEHLLSTTSYSTVEIARMSAFGTFQTFHRVFKSTYGMTPGEYRNQVRK